MIQGLPMVFQPVVLVSQRMGADLDISVLPTQGSIERHLGEEVMRLSFDEGGALVTRTGTVPEVDPLMSLGWPVALVMQVLAPQPPQNRK